MREASRLSGLFLLAIAGAAGVLTIVLPPVGGHALSTRFFWTHDAAFSAIIALGLFGISAAASSRIFSTCFPKRTSSRLAVSLACGILALICFVGHYALLAGHDFTRDEQMANFDAFIFSHQRLNWPIVREWREFLDALNSMYLVVSSDASAWMSFYLPVNALFRSIFLPFGAAALVSPLWVAVGAAALVSICEKLWPDDQEAKLIAFLLYACSGQIVFAGMTAYAMSAHLALNLLWLRAFLEHNRRGDGLALCLGFLASGLHQLAFHPLFAAPILCLTLVRGEFGRAAFFFVGYLLVAAFWIWWPQFALAQAGGGAIAPHSEPLEFFASEAAKVGPEAVTLFLLNVVRAITWQHVLLLPLFALGARDGLRGDPLVGALVGASAMPFVMFSVVPAWQGVGWGYRYCHAALGAAIIVGVYGWRSLRAEAAHAARIFAIGALFTCLVILPFQALHISSYYRAAAKADRLIDSADADLAIVDNMGAPFGMDLVVNAPDLSNRPVRLASQYLDERDLEKLCKENKSVAFFHGSDFNALRRAYGLRELDGSGRNEDLTESAGRHGCRIISG